MIKEEKIKKRVVIHKPELKQCKICQKEISLYSLSSHIKWSHNMVSDKYAMIYGEFRKPKRNPSQRKIKKIVCRLCNIEFSMVGLFGHLRDTHNISPDEYVRQFEEYRPSKLRQTEYKTRLNIIDKGKKQSCIICKEEFASGILLGYHIKNIHNINKKEYINKCVFNGIHPICKCGCGRKVKLLNYYPYKVDYVSGHNNDGETNPMFGKKHSVATKIKMSIKAIERIEKGIGKTIDTEPELRFKIILDKFSVKYEHPYNVDLGNRMASVDFYLPEKDILVEIDGEYWHPDKLENLSFYTLPNIISDKQREVLDNMVHIKSLDLKKYEELKTKDELFDFILNFSNQIMVKDLHYKQSIINKEYFKICLDRKGKDYVKSYSWLLLKFIRIFQPTFPRSNLEESLPEIINKIQQYDISKVYNSDTKEFSNGVSTVGHNYLKYYFNSYWKSKFNGNKSPTEAWLDDKIMKEVIEYRIGCNNSNEIFDFSLHQLVRGLSARRITISFFKPLLAAAIYQHYLGNKENPVVLDPCCGFGGRLLGFKSKYPNGTYVGCEPNIETYNELLQIKENFKWNDVTIYNYRFEDFTNDIFPYDLVFTSIPYYNVEVYSNNIEYTSFDIWKNTFIKSIEKYSGKQCYINAPEELCLKLGWNNIDSYILSNRSHFDNRDGKKKEWIVKL